MKFFNQQELDQICKAVTPLRQAVRFTLTWQAQQARLERRERERSLLIRAMEARASARTSPAS